MKLPKEIEGLKEPKFILMPPVGVQYGFLIIVLLASITVFSYLIYTVITAGGLSFVEGFIGVIMLMGTITASYPPYWKRWASFACDRNGIYLNTIKNGYIFKPWHEVGDIYIGRGLSSFEGTYEDVIAKIKLTDDEMNEYLGNHPTIYPDLDEQGYFDCGLGQQMQNVNETLASIERVRKLSGKNA